MNPQKVKVVVGVILALVVVGGLSSLATRGNKRASDNPGTSANVDDESSTGRRSRSGSFNASSNDPGKTKKGDKNSSGSKSTAQADDPGSASLAMGEALTTNALGETEAETRERERYEAAQRNAFKYRKLDPEKIKPTELAPAFEQASKKYNVPKELLAALAYVESGGTHRDGDHSMEAGYGVMNLRESNLVDTAAEAASILGKSKEDLMYDQKLNIEAAAALLSRYYEDALASGVSESEAWYMAVSQYAGRPNPELAAAHADEVAGFLIKGFQADVPDGGGQFSVPPNANPLFFPKNWKLVGLNPPAAPGQMPQPAIDPNDMKPPQ